jgi:hypothetical protein
MMRKTAAIFLSSALLTAIVGFAPRAMATWYQTYPGMRCTGFGNTWQNSIEAHCPIQNFNAQIGAVPGWEMSVDNINFAYVEMQSNYVGYVNIFVCNVDAAGMATIDRVRGGGSCAYTLPSFATPNTPVNFGNLNLPTSVGGSGGSDQFFFMIVADGGVGHTLSVISYGVTGT